MNKSIIPISLLATLLMAESIVEINPISVTATGIQENILDQALSIYLFYFT